MNIFFTLLDFVDSYKHKYNMKIQSISIFKNNISSENIIDHHSYALNLSSCEIKGTRKQLNGLKSLAKLFKFVVCISCQSSLSLTILVPLWFIIISLMFF